MKKVGLVACSNGQQPEKETEIKELVRQLEKLEITALCAEHLYAKDGVFGGTAKERAEDLMALYRDETIDAIFDLSGGDIANEVLDLLDYDTIGKSQKRFWGYSDLTTVLNAIYARTGKQSVLYQVKNLVWNDAKLQQERFRKFCCGENEDLFDIRYQFLQGCEMAGIVVGGNIRCLLKLAGTPYWPDMKGKILLLESLGGERAQLAAYFAQLHQMGVFAEVSGVILGTFTCFEQSETGKNVFEMLSPYISDKLPVMQTPDIGHGSDARAIVIGRYARFLEIETERLQLKPLGLRYLATVNEYATDPENTRYMVHLPNNSIEETKDFLRNAQSEWEKEMPSFYEFAVLFHDVQIGAVSIYLNDERDTGEFGWTINKKYWNRGFAYEAAGALLKYATEKLGIQHFIAHCDSENVASYRVMEKLGMKRVSTYGGRKNKLFGEERTEYQYEVKDPFSH
ncbi:MAG: GNAT family N-acetyltransferase [Lachnospiraceae bacterium]|nr:GNAT family N-acetyltransferase [Lachnospiraceae bacterium]